MAKQGTLEWHLDRMGCVTASNFHRVLGSAAVRQTYFNELLEAREAKAAGGKVAEGWLAAHDFDSAAMSWGRKCEPQARAAYELVYDTEVTETGFTFKAGDEFIGASLDGSVTGGTIEIKCPYRLVNHINTVNRGMPMQHLPQVQGGLWIAGGDFCDFISFHPEYEQCRLYVERVARDDRYIEMLEKAVADFARALATGAALPENETEDGGVPDLF